MRAQVWFGLIPQLTQSLCAEAQPTHTGIMCEFAYGKSKKTPDPSCIHARFDDRGNVAIYRKRKWKSLGSANYVKGLK